MTSWLLLVAASIIVSIMALLVVSVKDVDRQIGIAIGERQGLRTVAILSTLLRDASAAAGGSCAGAAPGSVADVPGDIAAMDAAEAENPLAGSDWRMARASARGSGFVARLTGLFPLVADRSALTYDPDVASVDLADSLTYRLPIAIDQLQRAQSSVCASDAATVAGRLAIAGEAGHASGYLQDGLSETSDAATALAAGGGTIAQEQERTLASTSAALASLAAFDARPTTAIERGAARNVSVAIADSYALMAATNPVLGSVIGERVHLLGARRFQLIVLGISAVIGASIIFLYGTRSALRHAEIERIRRSTEELRYQSMHDALTGLPNRNAFVAGVDDALARVRDQGGGIAVLFIDLDDFKLVNDSLGHEAGDGVLNVVARRLQSVGEKSGAALVARFSGDEFAIMLNGVTDDLRPRIDTTVNAIAAAMAEPVSMDAAFDRGVVISASIGIAGLDGVGAVERDRVAVDLLREADAAMYEAKAAGRGRSQEFGSAMLEHSTLKLLLMNDLRGAAERGEFFLEFQPFVNLAGSRTFGSEALVRWRHPKLGLLMPGSFLPVAEESGHMAGIGRWVFEESIKLFGTGFAPGETIHVNMSVGELLDDGFDQRVARVLAKYSVPPSAVAIEVIEGSLIRSGDRAENMLRRLRALGTKIWIDDFGVEYSSLRYLHRLPIDGVKIDRSFVGGIDGALASPAIVRLILELARSLELNVVAEGIETELQRVELLALGCANGQGFLFEAISSQVAL